MARTQSARGFTVFSLPEAHCRRMRAANPIERAIQQELERHTREIRVFPNEAALERLATAILVDIDEEWIATDRAFITMAGRDGRSTPTEFTDSRLRNLRLPSPPKDRATF
jgi:transposase-like protein